MPRALEHLSYREIDRPAREDTELRRSRPRPPSFEPRALAHEIPGSEAVLELLEDMKEGDPGAVGG
jgi:hypothetical protein